MKNKYIELHEDILNEEKAIEETLKRFLKVKEQFLQGFKDYATEPAMGTYLMNFYNGIENIIKRIGKLYYLNIPKGENWHKELLLLSASPPEGKIPLFSQDIVERLNQFRNFRHRFVSGYGFQLKGEKMQGLIDEIEPLWENIKKSILDFINKLDSCTDINE